jgi:hypothetical protein
MREARRLITFILDGNGHPMHPSVKGRIGYYKLMEFKFGCKRVVATPDMQTYDLLYFLPYLSCELPHRKTRSVLYGQIRTLDGRIDKFHFDQLQVVKDEVLVPR